MCWKIIDHGRVSINDQVGSTGEDSSTTPSKLPPLEKLAKLSFQGACPNPVLRMGDSSAEQYSNLLLKMNKFFYFKALAENEIEHTNSYDCYFARCFNVEAKSSTEMGAIFYPMFANCVLVKTMFAHVSERECFFFSPNCSKFAVDYDWIVGLHKTFKICFFLEK